MTIAALLLMSSVKASTAEAFLGFGRKSDYEKAEQHLADGEYYSAKKKLEKFLVKNPDSIEAQTLMAKILDREIARRKELFETKAPEEFSIGEKRQEREIWLDRAKGLMQAHQYDQAALAAEKVFEFDPENLEASQLMDQIKLMAMKEGKQESLLVQEMARQEVKDRIELYERQAENWIEKGQFGAARLASDKILLLDPENKKGLEVREKIKKHQQTQGEDL